MLNTILTDFSRVLLFPKDKSYTGKLNRLYKELSKKDSDYSFLDYFEFNEDLLNFYKNLKNKFSLHIFTTGSIQNHPEVRKIIDPIFDNIFSAEDFSLHKNAPYAYTFIARKLDRKPDEIIFIDDKRQNLEAAEKVGLSTILYRGNEKLFTDLEHTIHEVNNSVTKREHIHTVAYIHIKDRKLLLTLCKGKEAYYMAGGKPEKGEDDKIAFIREIKEELGVDIIPSSIKLYGTFEAQAYGKAEGVIVRITCFTADHIGDVNPQTEIEKIRFFSTREYLNMPQTAPAVRLIFQDLQSKKLIQ